MRPYVRPLIVTFSTLALATLFSYVAILLTDAPSKKPDDSPADALSAEAKAVLLFFEAKAAAASGDPEKLMALANFYLLGIGTEKNEVESARLHRQAAEKGHAPALTGVATLTCQVTPNTMSAKNAAWPKLTSPPKAIIHCRLRPNSIITITSSARLRP